jgi:hypothetical protein
VGREVAGRDTLSARSVPLLPIRNRDLEGGGLCAGLVQAAPDQYPPAPTVTKSETARLPASVPIPRWRQGSGLWGGSHEHSRAAFRSQSSLGACRWRRVQRCSPRRQSRRVDSSRAGQGTCAWGDRVVVGRRTGTAAAWPGRDQRQSCWRCRWSSSCCAPRRWASGTAPAGAAPLEWRIRSA